MGRSKKSIRFNKRINTKLNISMSNESEMRVCNLVPDLPFKYAEGGRGGREKPEPGQMASPLASCRNFILY